MAAACRGICYKYKSTGTAMQFKYQKGQKRCSFCGIFIYCGDARCPCCHMILRTRARNSISRKKRLSASVTNKH